ncbi:MAG: aminopeptidase [Opitutaceae bacterium]|nr:aminopeptidase [Opitutaceae bacterium]
MHARTSFVAAAACAAFCAVAFFTASPLRAAEKPDYKATAERIVGQCAGVKEGDRVVVRGDLRDIEFVEELTLAVWRRGAEPIQVLGRERALRRYFDEVPAKVDTLPASLSLKLAGIQTVDISIYGEEFPGQLDSVAPARIAATGQRSSDVFHASLKAGVRHVSIGNGLYPTDATAKQHGLSKAQLADLYWKGINVDYAQMQAKGAALKAILAAGKEVRVTHPNGTNLICRIAGRPVFVSAGVISAEDVAKGGAALQAWLPAGEVYLVPVPGTAEGKIVHDTLRFAAGVIRGATFTVKAGKMVAHAAQPGPEYELWKKRYAAAPASRDDFAYVDIGINPNVKVPAGSKLTSWVPAGAVSLGFGGNVWAGGANTISWATGGSINGCTLTVDGKVVVENGVLK